MLHVDRMRQTHPQTLRGEACDEERSALENGPEFWTLMQTQTSVDGRQNSVLVKAIAWVSAIFVYGDLLMPDAYFS